jgi:hypothetical protein
MGDPRLRWLNHQREAREGQHPATWEVGEAHSTIEAG